jgi:hypothetical protein
MCKKWSRCNGWPTQMERMWKKRSHYDGWPAHMKDDGLIMTGDLPRWKMMVSLWRVTSQMERMWSVVSLLWVTYPNERCDVTSVKNGTYLVKSWRDDRKRAEKLGAS